MALEIRSLGDLEKIPYDTTLEVVRYLGVNDRVKFTLLTSKKIYEATRMLGDYETRRIAEIFGLGGYCMNDAEVFEEMKVFTLALMRLLEIGVFQISNDFGKAFNFVNLYFSSLNLPTLTLMIFSGKENLSEYNIVMKKILMNPEKYKVVLRHLTRDHYKCDRSQLMNMIKMKITALNYFHFKYLIEYNKKSITTIFLRDGIPFQLLVSTVLIGILLYFYVTDTENIIKVSDMTSYMIVSAVIAGVTINRYLNARYEQYLE